MSSGTGNYFMNLPKPGESGGRILAPYQPTGTGTSGANYESTGITNAFPPYIFSFFGGKKRKTKRRRTKKRKIQKLKSRKMK
jgi:hypothetical protein